MQPSTPVVEYRMPSSQWCRSIEIDRNENYVVLGFENSVVRFFKTANAEQPREDRLHRLQHPDCRDCPPVDTLSFSADGLALIASTRNFKTGTIHLHLWRFPFLTFHELTSCRYDVPLHESEDNGTSAALFRSGAEGEDNLICITTWTQSGGPILAQPRGGHKSHIRTEVTGRNGKLGNRIQCAAFSPSGRELAMVNDKGHLYQISNLNSSPMDVRRIATSKELTAKTGTFAMGYMALAEEDSIVLAWTEPSKGAGWIKKIPIARRVCLTDIPFLFCDHFLVLTRSFEAPQGSIPETPGVVYVTASHGNLKNHMPKIEDHSQSPVELAADHVVRELDADQNSLPGDTKQAPLVTHSYFDHRS